MPDWTDERNQLLYEWENIIPTVDYVEYEPWVIYGPNGEPIYTSKNPIGFNEERG